MSGSCGGGPVKEQYAVKWRVNKESEHLFMSGEKDPLPYTGVRFGGGMFRRRGSRMNEEEEVMEMESPGQQSAYVSVEDIPDRPKGKEGPLGRMYSMLSKRRSFL